MNRMLPLSVLAAAFLVHSAHAQGNQAILDLLLRKGLITSQDLQEVKAQLDTDMARWVEQHSKTKTASWLDRVTFYGDLRLRVDNISYEESFQRSDRLRFRARLRLGADWKFADWAVVGARLGSGEGYPGTNFQTFTDTFRKKPIFLDAIYVSLQLPPQDWLRLTAGKMNNPIWQPQFSSPMTYDFDVTPEGVAEQLTVKFGDQDQHRLFANLGQFAAKEFASDANDVYLFDFEAGAELKWPRLKLTAAGGYFFTHNLANNSYKVGDSSTLGNTTVVSAPGVTNYFADFQVVYGRTEVAWTLSDKPFLGTPPVLTLSGEYLKNVADAYKSVPDDPNQTDGWSLQVTFGQARKKGQWQIAYQYKHLQADASWDAIADSEFGVGGTDRKGHILRATYNIEDWWQIIFTSFITQKISSRPNSNPHNQPGFPGENLLRLELDSSFRF